MRRFAGFAILAVGLVLLVWGANASQSVSSDISRFFTGAVTNKAIYLILGGAVAVMAGASMVFRRLGKQA